MLTARVEETDRIVGLELGADDYITKPFSPRELVARIRAVLRRADATLGGGELVRAGEVTLDIPKRRVTVRDGEVELTATEFDLLLTLARHPGRIYTRAQLLDNVHGVTFESYERSIDAHVKNIRRKIESDPRHPGWCSPSTASATGSPMPRRGWESWRRSRGGAKVERPGRDSGGACSSASLHSCCSP